METIPNDKENQRLAALLSYKISESEQDISFQDLTFLAANICETPIATVTLVEDDQARFKSSIGLNIQTANREDVFCNLTIKQKDVFVVEDTLRNFSQNPYVAQNPHIRFYAAAPLIDDNGYALGTICVMDYKPRKITPRQTKALKVLANQVMSVINLKKSQDTLKDHFHELQKLTHFISQQQEQIVQSAKLSSLGEMANGVAHEINNPLSVIDHAMEKISRTRHMDMNAVTMIQKSIRRITKIIHGLRNYSRDGNKDPKEVINVKKVLMDTLELYSSRAQEEGIDLWLESDEVHEVEAIHIHLSQIVMNLVQNAFQAVHHAEKKWIRLKSFEDQDEVVIEVSDSGPGIDKSMNEIIFDPFFTTKESAEGSGLGLSTAKKLAEKNGGSLFLDTTSASTKFVLRLKEPKKSFPEHVKEQPDRPQLAS